jgi:N-acetylmuramoyl-L-alanine amidase
VIEISEEPVEQHGSELSRTALRSERMARRRRMRNTALLVVGILVMGGVTAVVIVLLTLNSSGLKIPHVIGMTYKDAKKKVESAGLFIEVDPMQDSSGDCDKLKVESQDPKPGTGADIDETITVRLKGLHESAEYTGQVNKNSPVETPGQAAPTEKQTPAPAPSQRIVCVDPGHSGRSGSEIDPATGLNVGDNGGASGEPQNMWDLAQKTKAHLEQAGYSVRRTKDSASAYASLRQRADIGNGCAIVVRLHYDDTGFTGVMRPPQNAARCPSSDPSRITVVDPGVAAGSDALAQAIAPRLGLSVRDDTGGTSQGNTTPPGHPTCLIGSVLSRVPVVCIENSVSRVKDNPGGQDAVAAQIVAGINLYFQTH